MATLNPNQQQESQEGGYNAPSYLVAADTHNIANGNDSWWDAATSGTAGVLTSAVVQTANILPTVGNWFGGDFEHIKTKEVLQSFDDDMGKYYERHSEGIDALGFALGSLVPGMVGTKVLRAGQAMLTGAAEAGTLGSNLSAATKILAPSQPKYLAAAVEAALKPNNGFSVWNTNTIKAIASGAGQAFLEGVAFETAVSATMYNSPVLEGKDLGDLASNILWSGVTFSAIGGVGSAASSYFKIKGAAKALDIETAPWNTVRELGAGSSKSSQALNYFEQIHTMPKVPEGIEAWKADKIASLAEYKGQVLETRIRSITGELAGGDQVLADNIYHQLKKLDLSGVESKLWATDDISRLGTKTPTEKSVDAAMKRFVAKGNEFASETDRALITSKETTFVKLTGEGAGKVAAEQPEVWSLADTLSKGKVLSVTQQGVGGAEKFFEFRAGATFDSLTANHFESEARNIWVRNLTSQNLEKFSTVGAFDLPVLDHFYALGKTPAIDLGKQGGTWIPASREEFLDFLKSQKEKTLSAITSLQGRSLEEAAKVANTSEAYAKGVIKGSEEQHLFGFQKNIADFQSDFKAAGREVPGEFWDMPSWSRVVKDTSAIKDLDNHVVTGLAAMKVEQVMYENGASRAVAVALGEDAARFVKLTDSDISRATRVGPGGGFVSAQNENYGTLGSKVQEIGTQTLKTIQKFHASTRELFEAPLYKLANNQAAAIEWSVLNNELRKYGEVFTYDAAAGGMRPLALVKYERALQAGIEAKMPAIADDIPLLVPVKNADTAAVIQSHLSKNGERLEKLGGIRANQGVKWARDPEGFYPIPPNLKDYPHFAIVVDDSIGGAGHSTRLYAATAEDLEAQMTKVKSADPTLKILTKSDAEGYYKSIGQYEYERTLTDASFNTVLKRTGVSASYLPSTDSQKIVSDFLNWHLERDSALVRESVAHLNEAQIASLRTAGEGYTNVATSHFTKISPLAYLDSQAQNPYGDYVKSMLGLSTKHDFPFWSPVNEMLDRNVSKIFNSAYEMFHNAKSPEELTLINKHLQDAGYKGAAYDSMTHAFANHTAPKGALSAFIAKANAILSTTMLGLDPINALNNVIGAPILRSTELRSLIRGIKEGNADVAGKLAGLSEISVPGTGGSSILSPAKLMANAMSEFHSPEGKALREVFKDRGIISSRVEQTNWVLENLALTGKESVGELEGKIGKVFRVLKESAAKGEKITGNSLAEEFNRFVSGHVAKQITDKAVEAGILGEKEAWSYINTFVNRVEGNYIASQRPGVFQGPLGQAMGLFQTYQFNLLQQLLRHVGEGSVKDAAFMMGLQGTIYGMRGLPAFDAINTHLIGNASGNSQHRDLYTSVYGAAGKEAGNWLLYGAGSNALGLLSPDLKFNLYSRGDINPRNVTLLPINPANVPFVQAATKMYGSLTESFAKIGQGGDVVGSLLQGIEHAGVSRPLSGLAQALEAANNPMAQSFSTSGRGNVIAANDFISLTNMIRVAGAKPLDEALALDTVYRNDAYAAKDSAKRALLGEAIKTTVIAGKNPSEEQVSKFATEYAATGGKQDKFAQFMMQQYKRANSSQVNDLVRGLGGKDATAAQRVMGGYELQDFSNQ